jgi:hypothetical protein
LPEGLEASLALAVLLSELCSLKFSDAEVSGESGPDGHATSVDF